MSSNFEEQKKKGKVIIQEYVCGVCCRWFIVEKEVRGLLICPFCGKVAMINDEIEL